MKQLRPYQAAAAKSLWHWLNTTPGNPLIVAPVGAGKSLMIADMIREIHSFYPRTRIVVLAHVKELLEQNAEELRAQYPTCDFNFYCAGLGIKRLNNDVTFASIQSIHNKITAFNRPPEIVFVDECHLISHDDATTYQKFIAACKLVNPNVKFVGYTGSAFRADTGRLDQGENKIFDGIAYEIAISWMIEQGYLVRPVKPDSEVTQLSATGVGSRGGDYIIGQLQRKIDIPEITKACVDEIIFHGNAQNRKRWFVMTAGVQHCEHTREYFRLCGIECEMVTGDKKVTSDDERKRIIKWFKEPPVEGEPPRCLINVGTLNVGFNAIHIDLLAPMRPTRSPVLYIQFTGRGLRPVYVDGYDLSTQAGRLQAIADSSKPNVLFLDFGGIIRELGPIDAVNVDKIYKKEEEETGGPAPFKICPSCGATCATAQKNCYDCSYDFAAHSVERVADKKSAVLVQDIKPDDYRVVSVDYRKHWKGGSPEAADGAPPTLRVVYTTLKGQFSEYVCFQHPEGTFPQKKAEGWFKRRLPDSSIPTDIDGALLIAGIGSGRYEDYAKTRKLPNKYPVPKTISIIKEGKYDRIVKVDFSPLTEAEIQAEEKDDPSKAKWIMEDLDDEIPF